MPVLYTATVAAYTVLNPVIHRRIGMYLPYRPIGPCAPGEYRKKTAAVARSGFGSNQMLTG